MRSFALVYKYTPQLQRLEHSCDYIKEFLIQKNTVEKISKTKRGNLEKQKNQRGGGKPRGGDPWKIKNVLSFSYC